MVLWQLSRCVPFLLLLSVGAAGRTALSLDHRLPHSTHLSPAVGAKKPANVTKSGLLPEQEWIRVGDLNSSIISDSIILTLDYLVANCNEKGRFAYLRDLRKKRKTVSKGRYNWVRHAGVIYALAQARAWAPSYFTPRMESAMIRAALYLKANAFGPVHALPAKGNKKGRHRKGALAKPAGVPDEPMLGIWSTPKTTKNVAASCVKLGAVGLGMIALLAVEKVKPGLTPLTELQELARFLLFMQQPDGSFHSKYPFELEKGFRSVYYPGEAAFALVLMYEKDGDVRWLRAAAKALAFLVKERQGGELADHWDIIATARFLPHFKQLSAHAVKMQQHEFEQHALDIAAHILSSAPTFSPSSIKSGCLVKSGETTPTATRMEGLLASLEILGAKHLGQQHHIKSQLHASVAFLLRAQIRHMGRFKGAFPNALPSHGKKKPKASEIRIDYVQHALSALCLYHHVMFDKAEPSQTVVNAAPQRATT